MILKPGDVVLFKDKLTTQVKAKLKEWHIPESTFNEYKGTYQIITNFYGDPTEKTVKIKNSPIFWPIQLLEEDNEL